MHKSRKFMNKRNPWAWVPTLYFAEGVPYVAVMTISLILYKRLGLSNTDITLYTSWLYLPWVIKPLWSPFVDMLKSKRWWIVTMQLLIGAALGGVAFTIPVAWWLQGSLFFFWMMAFASATHDIAADAFYMMGLDEHEQAYFVGIRSTFYRIATIFSSGLLVGLAGALQVMTRSIRYSWSLVLDEDGQRHLAGVPSDRRHLLPETTGLGWHLLHALLPYARRTAGQDFSTLPRRRTA